MPPRNSPLPPRSSSPRPRNRPPPPRSSSPRPRNRPPPHRNSSLPDGNRPESLGNSPFVPGNSPFPDASLFIPQPRLSGCGSCLACFQAHTTDPKGGLVDGHRAAGLYGALSRSMISCADAVSASAAATGMLRPLCAWTWVMNACSTLIAATLLFWFTSSSA